MFSVELTLLIPALLIVFAGAVVQGTMGVGFGQVAAAGLIWIEPAMVPTAVIIMGFCVAVTSALREFSRINYQHLQIALTGRILGALLSIPVLIWVGKHDSFALLFGGFLIAAVLISLLPIRPTLSNRTLALGGATSGLMGTITSIGGPPMGLIYQDQTASEVRSTLNAFFAVGSIISLGALWYSGLFGLEHIFHAIVLAPGFLLGTYASRWFSPFVDKRYRPLILGFCIISAATLILRGLW
ncbi:MAG: sulfite exporter TauE/SafE family protein [Pseudomonadota bacterium]